MKRPPAFVGVDLGAESGRVVAGTLDAFRTDVRELCARARTRKGAESDPLAALAAAHPPAR